MTEGNHTGLASGSALGQMEPGCSPPLADWNCAWWTARVGRCSRPGCGVL